jgi:hypothetical protein
MKKLIYITILAASLASCSEFLTEEPKLTQSDVLTMSNYDGLNSVVAGAYGPFNSSYWYGANYVLSGEISSGNAKNPTNTTDYPGSGRYKIQGKWSYSAESTSPIWAYCYYTISAVNNVLSNIEGKTTSEVSQNDVNNLRAEALFLRALCYHDLVTVYAMPYTSSPDALGVPVVLTTENGKPARNTVKETYAQITSDLIKADSLMDEDYARANLTDAAAGVTKPAIWALLSRVYLYMGNWQKAADYATKVINCGKYNLVSGDDYLKMFTAATAPKDGEIIFEMYSSNKNDYWDLSGWDEMSYITSPSDDQTGSADVCASEDLIKLFSEDDVRLGLYTESKSTWFCLKYAGKKGSSVPKENNTIIFRLSEMYLTRAEAIVNGAVISGVTAEKDMKALADVRGITAESPSKTSIFNERRKELAFEGHYFFDCKRTQTSVTRTDGGGINMDGTSKKWAMPIPKHEIDANPNCKQNEY